MRIAANRKYTTKDKSISSDADTQRETRNKRMPGHYTCLDKYSRVSIGTMIVIIIR